MKHIFFLAFCGLFISSCSVTTVVMQNGEEEQFRSLKQYVKHSPQLNSYHFGMQLFDLENQEVVFATHDDQFFTPASVTKWLTLYTATHFLEDSLAWMNVYEVDGETIYQPQGDPSFLHPDFETDTRIKDYFAHVEQDTIYWSESHFQDQKYGSGWAWDDSTYSFQSQKSTFPIHSNLVHFGNDSVIPSFISPSQYILDERDGSRYVPFEADSSVIESFLLQYDKVFQPYENPLAKENLIQVVYSIPAKNAYKVLMQQSDNHIAEQLLLQVSQKELNKMNTEAAILLSKKVALNQLKDDLQWVDGSGLSRYNMVTPRAIIYVINQMVDKQGIEWLQDVLPTGGQSGTIQNHYAYSPPRVWAKTGTLRHNHNLAGLVQAKSGKIYSFCIMNNHFSGSSSIAKAEMENLLKILIEQY